MLADYEFECLRGELALAGVHLNTTVQDEHVGEIERYIRTVKEQARAIYNMLPFDKMQNRLVTEMVYSGVFWMNNFPAMGGVSETTSPREIMTVQSLDYNKHFRLEFGSYVQVHEQNDNSMVARTTGAIALRPTGNVQGGYYFMSLTTGKCLIQKHWTPILMTANIIARVQDLAAQERTLDGDGISGSSAQRF
jgi:hypothetical protein